MGINRDLCGGAGGSTSHLKSQQNNLERKRNFRSCSQDIFVGETLKEKNEKRNFLPVIETANTFSSSQGMNKCGLLLNKREKNNEICFFFLTQESLSLFDEELLSDIRYRDIA